MKKFAVLVVAAMFFAVASPMFAAPFSDVPRTHWAYDAIQKAVDAGILQGYDGKYHGKRLLNRYQMAVIVAKMLDRMKGMPTGGGGMSGDVRKMIANLEALTIEFADELALLNVKVSTLEDSFTELKNQVDNMKNGGGHVASSGGGLGFTAFASFGLISTDDVNAGGTAGPLTRYNITEPDQLFFTLPQVSIGVDKEVNEGVFFHAQFDYASDVNSNMYGTTGLVGINEAYFFLDEMFGEIGGKVGAFALPFSLEHNGPFRTLNYTITPAAINAINEGWRGYGIEFTKVKDVEPGDLIWKFGVVSGTDPRVGAPGLAPFWVDVPSNITALGEVDDSFGFYIQIAKPSQGKGKIGWNFTYWTNGGDATQTTATQTDEVDYFQVGIDWSNDDFYVLLQYVAGDWTGQGTTFDNDLTAYVILINFKIDEKQSISLRYDTIEIDPPGAGELGANAITFAYNRKVTDNSMFQFEYLSPDDDSTGAVDEDDNLIQLRYKVHF